MAAARPVLPRAHGDHALTRRLATGAAVAATAAGLVWWLDAVLVHRTADGTDHAVRLAAVFVYVGVDRSYILARALGAVALVTAYAAVLVSLLPGRSPATSVRAALHRQLGVVTALLVIGHALVPYTSVLPPYGGWVTNFVPWAQPVSWGLRAASWESMGILALYMLLMTGPTFYVLRHRPSWWRHLHRLSYAVYALAVAHVLLLGTDFMVAGPPRWFLLGAQIPLLALLARRLSPSAGCARRPVRLAAAGVSGAAAIGTAVLTAVAASGGYATGLRL